MNRETFRLSQKELQRVVVISSCIKGDLACARAAELLAIPPRHVHRLKVRYRQGSAEALAHASRGRPSPRRLPEQVRARILDLARTRYAGFNDHHLCEKLCDVEGLPLGRETLRRLLRSIRRCPAPPTAPPPTSSCAASCPTTIGASATPRVKRKNPGAPAPLTSSASAASCTNARSATTTSCSGTDAASRSRPNPNASASPGPRFSFTNHSKEKWPSITDQPSSTTAVVNFSEGGIFIGPLG